MRTINGRHVLFGLLSFFGLMLAVNGVFVYVATTTFTGAATEDAYRKGLKYNETIRAFREQQAAGWQHEVTLAGDQVTFEVRTADGAPVDHLAISATLGRPATAVEDRPLAFRELQGGIYVASTGELGAGQWVLAAEARPHDAGDAAPFKVTARLWAKP